MCISMFYAQIIGLWLFLVALAMIVHHPRLKKTVTETLSNPSLMTYSGLIALAVGLLIVIHHNIWIAAWPVVITIFGWVLIIQGIMRIFWPDTFIKMMKDLLAGNGYTVMTWVWLIVGAYLIYYGFLN